MRRSLGRMGSMLILCGVAVPLLAQTQRAGGGDNQRIMQQYQQLAAEKTALEAQAGSLKRDLDAAHAELAAVKKERDALKSQSRAASANAALAAELAAGKQAAEHSAEQTKERMTELVTHFRETANNLKQVEADRDRLQGELRDRSTAYDKCVADNLSLYELNGEILNRYEHVGFFTRVGASEPFTKIARTRIENLVDEYRARALELREKSDKGDKGGEKPPGL
jgi:chromosome segregation ATPase